MNDEELLATVKRRADHLAQHIGAGYHVLQHHPDLGVACHYSTDGAGAVRVQISREGRRAFNRIVYEAIGEAPQPHEHTLTFKIPTEGSA